MVNNSRQYHLYAIANFVAAFGGGIILGKGISAINANYIQDGTILAFFIGTALGLLFLNYIPSQFSKLFANSFSFCGALVSLILLGTFVFYSHAEKINGLPAYSFFLMLSIRFAFWFYGRVTRVSKVAGYEQRIAWVELGYYAGMILGLIIWEFIGIIISLPFALIIDALMQTGAGLLDVCADSLTADSNSTLHDISQGIESSHKILQGIFNHWYWRLAIAVTLLTVGTQVLLFSLIHQLTSTLGSYLLATFYGGVSVGAMCYNRFKIKLHWLSCQNERIMHATLQYTLLFKVRNISSFWLIVFIFASVITSMLVTYQLHWYATFSNDNGITQFPFDMLLLSLIGLGAFFYEIFALAILDRISFEGQNTQSRNMIMRTYGLMGVSAALSLWLIGLVTQPFLLMLMLLFLCMIGTFMAISKRRDFSFASETIFIK